MFLLMSPRQLFEHFKDDYEIHDISWSEEKAGAILEAWQRKFVEVGTGNSPNMGLCMASPSTQVFMWPQVLAPLSCGLVGPLGPSVAMLTPWVALGQMYWGVGGS